MTPAEFSALYDRHSGEALRAANEVLRDVRLAEEVVQDVFLALWRGAGYDAGRGGAGPYLRRLARNRAIDVWRRRRAAAGTAARYELATAAPDVEVPEHAVSLADRRAAARAAVGRLPEDQRLALALTYWGGLTIAETAEHLDIPLGTAKSRVRLALRRLAGDPALAAAA